MKQEVCARRNITFISMCLASALAWGFASLGILLSMSDAYSSMMLSAVEMQWLEFGSRYFSWLTKNMNFVFAAAVLLPAAALMASIFVIIPGFRWRHLKDPWNCVKVAAFLLFFGVMLAPGMGEFAKVSVRTGDLISIGPFWVLAIISMALGGAVWAVAGLMLWPMNGKRPGLGRRAIILRGITAGLAVYLILRLSAFVNEVFSEYIFYAMPGGGEIPILRITEFCMIETAVGLLASLAVSSTLIAFSLDKGMKMPRMNWISIAFGICVIFVMASSITYAEYYGRTKPLRSSLVETVGMDVDAREEYMLLLMAPVEDGGGFMVQRWPLTGWVQNRFKPLEWREFELDDPETWNNESYPLTPGNLAGLEEFSSQLRLAENLKWEYQQSIIYGYFNMLDFDAGRRKLLDYSYGSMFSRLMFYSAMNSAPTTPGNRALIREYAHYDGWHIDERTLERISSLLYCAGLEEEARRWVEEHRARTGNPANFEDVHCHDPVNGRIRGKIAIDGILPENFSLLVRRAGGRIEKIKYHSVLRNSDVTELGPNGEFEFTHLRESDYYLVLVDKAGTLSDNGKAIEVMNNPGLIAINSSVSDKDLGTIEIRINGTE